MTTTYEQFEDHYNLIVTSSALADSRRKWRNTIAILDTGGTPQPTDTIVENVIATIASVQWPDSQVVSAELRIVSVGDAPLDNEGALWREDGLNIVGTANTTFSTGLSGSHPCDGDIAVLVHKQQGPGGRIGKLFLHNLLRQEMLDMNVGGKPTLNSTFSNFLPFITAALDAGISSSFLGTSPDPGLVTIHYSLKVDPVVFFARGITSLVAVGVTEHQLGRGQ